MKEFIEKLIGRLEENSFDMSLENPDCKAVWTDKAISIVNQLAEECNPIINYNTLLNDIKSQLKQFIADSNNIDYNRALVEAIEVIDKKAEEYNGGWIPCSERLPEDFMSFEYLTIRKGHTLATISFYCVANKKWYLSRNSTREIEVIAWQPLPQAYQPKGEQE